MARGRRIWRRYVSDDKPKWDTPTNVKSSKLDAAGELAKKHGISPDRAQMLIDRFGEDAVRLQPFAPQREIFADAGRIVSAVQKYNVDRAWRESRRGLPRRLGHDVDLDAKRAHVGAKLRFDVLDGERRVVAVRHAVRRWRR